MISVQGVEPVEGRQTYRLRMELRSTGLTASIHQFSEVTETWLDQGSLTTLRYTRQARESKYAQDETVLLDQTCRRFCRHKHRLDKEKTEMHQGRLPGPTLDILGYLFYLRTLPLKEGQTYDLSLLSGDNVWPVTVRVTRRTKISSPAGWFETFFLEPKLREKPKGLKLRELQVWISADERRIPVRLRMELGIGHITAELQSIETR